MRLKPCASAAIAAALAVMTLPATAQPQHAQRDEGADTRTMGQAEKPACPMMGKKSDGGTKKGRGGMHDDMGAMMDGTMMQFDAADLSEQQRERIAALHGRQAEKHVTLMMRMKDAKRELQELTAAQPLDLDAIEQAYERLAETRKEMFVSRIEARQQIQEIVEPQESSQQ